MASDTLTLISSIGIRLCAYVFLRWVRCAPPAATHATNSNSDTYNREWTTRREQDVTVHVLELTDTCKDRPTRDLYVPRSIYPLLHHQLLVHFTIQGHLG